MGAVEIRWLRLPNQHTTIIISISEASCSGWKLGIMLAAAFVLTYNMLMTPDGEATTALP